MTKTKREEIQYISSDQKQEAFSKTLTACAQQLEVELVTIDPGLLTAGEVDKINDYSVINDWFDEKFDTEKEKNKILNTDDMDGVIKKYGTPYVLKTGIATIVTMTGRKRTYFYGFLYDLKKNELLYRKYEFFNTKDRKDLVNAKTYQMLFELKKPSQTISMIFSKKTTVLFSLILLNVLGLKAQAPGYMGKRTVAGYGFYFNPAISAALIDYGTKIINTQHEFFLERAMKRGLSLGGSFKLYRSTYNNTGSVDMTVYSGYSYSLLDPGGVTEIKGKELCIVFKIIQERLCRALGKIFFIGANCQYTLVYIRPKYNASILRVVWRHFGKV